MPARFTEEELIIILDHYLTVRASGNLDARGLSEKLGSFEAIPNPPDPEHHRTPDGLRRVIGRFAAVDPDVPPGLESFTDELGDEALTHYRNIWDQYGSDPSSVRRKAAQLMSDSNSSSGIIGAVPNIAVGSVFNSRADLAAAGVHRPLQAGICGSAATGAESIVLSGGYEDNQDRGSILIYTGHGGKDPKSGKQISDQLLERQNLALAVSCDQGLPERVVRGADPTNRFAPDSGYRYEGLFNVESYDHVPGKSGFLVWQFRLTQDGSTGSSLKDDGIPSEGHIGTVTTRFTTVQRRVRNTTVTQSVKELHDHTCQICGLTIETATGRYSEGAHIRALGEPHLGPDTESNVLCLCPNDHVLFDKGALVIEQDFSIRNRLNDELVGTLRVHPGHSIDQAMLEYHRSLHEK
jgi:putative restriction endonuclease